jgi:hypothetical protein
MMRTSACLLSLPVALALLAEQDPVISPDAAVQTGAAGHAFEWVEGWPKLPADFGLGNTHGCMVVTKAGRLYVNTDTERAVVEFDPRTGEVVGSWGKELAGGLHGMCLVEEDGQEFLYLAHTGRHEVLKTTLEGEVLWTLGYPATSGHYESADQYRPTGVAVGPDGDLYVVDGYGRNWVHHYDADRRYLGSWGGPGEEPGQFKTCHGIWLDERRDPPELIVADRENHRLQRFDLEGELLGVVTEGLRRPCSLYAHGDTLVVADLAGRVTLLDGENRLIAHLCDNPDPAKRAQNGVPPEQWAAGEFIAPHSACFDAEGNLYVMDWNRHGRVTKLRRIDD